LAAAKAPCCNRHGSDKSSSSQIAYIVIFLKRFTRGNQVNPRISRNHPEHFVGATALCLRAVDRTVSASAERRRLQNLQDVF